MVQRSALCASNAGVTGVIPGRRTKIPHAVQGDNINKERNKTFEKVVGLHCALVSCFI